MRLGNGYAVAEMDRVEATAHRIERDGRIIAAFAIPSSNHFGASVSWTRSDGTLTVDFAENDTRLSADGQALLQRLRQELQKIYGDRVTMHGPI
jgi:hypothetical protein